MANNERTYDFTIRANDLSTQPINSAIGAVKKLVDVVNEQARASEKGTANATAFNASIRQLEGGVDSLLKQRLALIAVTEKEQRLADVSAKTAERQLAFDTALAALPPASERTAAQIRNVDRLAEALVRAETQQIKATDALEKQQRVLTRLGVDTTQVAQAQDQLNAALGVTSIALQRAGEAQREFNRNRETALAATRAAELAEREAAEATEQGIRRSLAPLREVLRVKEEIAEQDKEAARLALTRAVAPVRGILAGQAEEAAQAEAATDLAIRRAFGPVRGIITAQTEAAREAKIALDVATREAAAKVAADEDLALRRAFGPIRGLLTAQIEASREAARQIEATNKANEAAAADAADLAIRRAFGPIRGILAAQVEAAREAKAALDAATKAAEAEQAAAEDLALRRAFGPIRGIIAAQTEAARAAKLVADEAIRDNEATAADAADLAIRRAFGPVRGILAAQAQAAREAKEALDEATKNAQRAQAEANDLGLRRALGPARGIVQAQQEAAAAQVKASEEAIDLALRRAIGPARAILAAQAEATRLAKAELDKAMSEAEAEDAFRTRGLQRAREASDRLAATQAQTQAARASGGQPTQVGLGAGAAVAAALPGRDTQDTLDTSAAVQKLEQSFKAGTYSAQQYAKAQDDVFRIQRRLKADADLVDALHAQAAAVQQAEADFKRLEVELQRLIALQHTSADAANQLARAQSQYEAAGANVGRQVQAQAQLTAQAKARGIAENNLTGEITKQLGLAQRVSRVTDGVQKGKGLFGLDQFQAQNLTAQINDVVTQLSLGQGVARTLESQGGQILQVFNLTLGQIVKLLPVLAAVGGAVLFVAQAFGRVKESADALRGVEGRLIAIGDGGRNSASGLVDTQRAIEKLGVSFADAGEAISLFLEKGIRPDRMLQLAKAASDVTEVFGGDFKTRIKEVTSAFTGNYEAIAKLDDQLQFLTVAERQTVREAFEAGDAIKGQTIALEALSRVEAEAALRSRSTYTQTVRDLTEAYRALLDAFANTTALDKAINGLSAVTNRVTALVKLFSGEINGSQYREIIESLHEGTFKGFDITGERLRKARDDIKALVEQRDEYLRVVEIINRKNPGVDAVPQRLKDTLLDVEARLAKARGVVEELSGKVTPAGESAETLQRRLQDLTFKRDNLLKGTNPVVPPVEAPAETRSTAGYQQLLAFAAQQAGVDPELFRRLQKAENATRNPDGTFPQSPTGPQGGLQLSQDTFNEMKALHKDIVGGITDNTANALAGAYRLRQLLDRPEIGGDAFKAVIRYNTGPNTSAITDEARNEAIKVTKGYTGNPLQANTVAALNAQIEGLAQALTSIGGRPGSTPLAPGVADQNSPAVQKALLDYAKKLEDIADLQKSALLRGSARAEADAKALTAYEAKLRSEAPNLAKGDTSPGGVAAETQINRLVEERRDKLRKEREDQDQQAANEIKRLQEKARSELEARANTERSIVALRSSLEAQAGASDATNAQAQRDKVNDKFNLDVDRLRQEAKKTGTNFIGGVPLEDYIALLAKARDEVLATVTANASVASVNKVVEERATAYRQIQDDFKNGLISTNEAFARSLETTQKFAPRIVKAVADARKELAGQPQTAGVQAAAGKVDAVKTDAAAIEADKGLFTTGLSQLGDIDKTRKAVEAAQASLVARGEITAQQSRKNIEETYAAVAGDAKTKIDDLQAQLARIQASPTPFPAEAAANFAAQLEKAREQLNYVDPALKKLRGDIENIFTNRITQAFDSAAQSLGNFLAGTQSLSQVFVDVGNAFATMTAGILKDIATLILRTLILKAVQAGLNATGFGEAATVVGGLAKVAASHAGGIVGHPGGQSKVVDLSVFRGAQRMHSGGMVGLASDEVPTILQRGEQVLSKSQVRAQADAAGGANANGTTGIRNVLAVGDREIAQAMTGQHGERVVLNILRRNASTVRKMI